MTAPRTSPKHIGLGSEPRRGLAFMLLSCLSFSGMSALVFATQLREPAASPLIASFVRILVNLAVVFASAAATGTLRSLRGDGRPSLWARGMFGTVALMTSFAALKAVGIGEASFLLASSGIFVAVFAPFFLKQRNPPRVWFAIAGATLGLYLLFEPRLEDVHPWGRALAVFSGACSALAYMMIARAGRSNTPNSVIFYFCVVAVPMHLVAIFLIFDASWPREGASYALLATAGLLGSAGQNFLTRAYQTAPAALNSAVSYLGPVLNVGIGILAFGRHPDAKAWTGAAIVLIFGVMLPFSRRRRV